MTEIQDIKRLVIVSNRLPVILSRIQGDRLSVTKGSGGLITALAPVLRNRGGLWIGWSGLSGDEPGLEEALNETRKSEGYSFKSVTLSREEVEQFYYGFSNEIVWPLFHDLQSLCNFKPDYWDAYQKVNEKFADTTVRNTAEEDFIWVQDYHLMLMASKIKAMGMKRKMGFFLHIPFPPMDIFMKLPWWSDILSALLEYDLIGFQTIRDRRNFLQCIRFLRKGMGIVRKGHVAEIFLKERKVRAGTFPVSIDYNDFSRPAASKEVSTRAWFIHENLPNKQIILGIDRLDYTKGIPERLEAFRNALIRYPEIRTKVVFLQIVVPSREDLPRYNRLKQEIERLIGEINGQFTTSGWVPIQYIYRSLEREELLAYYRTSEIALITPLKDGMNLVAKEYCAASLETGVLILSEFAGASAQFQKHALLVNPYDIEGVANAIYRAFKMSPEERKKRMHRLRYIVKRYDIFWWVDSYLEAIISKNLENFPVYEDDMPKLNP